MLEFEKSSVDCPFAREDWYIRLRKSGVDGLGWPGLRYVFTIFEERFSSDMTTVDDACGVLPSLWITTLHRAFTSVK
jgi:hypothetical protein